MSHPLSRWCQWQPSLRLPAVPQRSRWRSLIDALLLASLLWVSAAQLTADDLEPVQLESTMMPTRDGTRLHTRIYRPASHSGPLPVLLLKTAYGLQGFDRQAKQIARRGYVAVTQDSSGRYGSEGEFNLYWGEPADGFDAVTWIREQPWCDGHVGMWGASYMGSVQWLTASTQVRLDAIAPTAAVTYFYDNIYRGGAFLLALGRAGFGANVYGPPPSVGASPKWPQWYLTLPLMDLDDVVGHRAPLQMSMIKHHRPDGFWRGTDARNFSQMDFPAQHIVGYYDFMCPGAVDAYVGMRDRAGSAQARQNQQLILGPWDHATGSDRAGDVVFGDVARLDIVAENLTWYDRWFKGIGRDRPYPRVRYFVMGANRWRQATDWPPPEARPTAFYLHSRGGANTRSGDGKLAVHPPQKAQTPDRFLADPSDPVPAAPAHGRAYVDGFGPYDQRSAQLRKDVLVYTTPPLEKPLTLAGSIRAELYVSTDTPDADVVVKLVDIRPDGFCHPLSTGILRAAARHSLLKLSPLRSETIYRLTVDVGHCAATIAPGHQLCVQVQGSHFPVYDRNTNTGEGPFSGRTRIATEVVHHDPEHPSRVLLPVLP